MDFSWNKPSSCWGTPFLVGVSIHPLHVLWAQVAHPQDGTGDDLVILDSHKPWMNHPDSFMNSPCMLCIYIYTQYICHIGHICHIIIHMSYIHIINYNNKLSIFKILFNHRYALLGPGHLGPSQVEDKAWAESPRSHRTLCASGGVFYVGGSIYISIPSRYIKMIHYIYIYTVHYCTYNYIYIHV